MVGRRDADAAKRLFGSALSAHPQPRVINTDLGAVLV
jgi:transposase-like protein